MDTAVENIKASRDIRDTTLKIYITNMKKLTKQINEEEFSMDMFISKQKQILEYLDTLSNSVMKKMISTIMVFISPKKNEPIEKYKSFYDTLKKKLNKENAVYLEKVANNKKSDKDEKNWVNMSYLLSVKSKLLKQIKALGYNFTKDTGVENKKDFFLIQKYLIACLYTELPPRRLIYANTNIVSEKELKTLSQETKDNNSYLVSVNKSKKYLYYGKDSDKSGTETNIIVHIPKSMNSLLNFWIKINKTHHLLLDHNGEKLTKNSLSKLVHNIFSNKDKDISVNLIRKVYVSEKFSKINQEKQKIGEQMNHSVSTQDFFYSKN